MESGTHRATRTVAIDERSRSLARLNLGERTQRGLPEEIKAAGSLEAAVAVVDRAEQANAASRERYGKTPTKKDRDRYEDWRKIAVAHYTPEDTQEVTIPYGPPMSLFALEARKLDGDRKKPYWSSTREMAARAFQAWCEDRLSGQQRRNDYLSAKADNRFYNDPIFGPVKPFPEGDERELINQAFDELVGAMREHGTLKAVMDAVFGDEGPIVAWWDVALNDDQGE
ncbi:MAG: hypothetical protein K9L88_10590 [Chromatiaceae bacterium]|nr:hypothetical protein [Chromatiaceae bacterium]